MTSNEELDRLYEALTITKFHEPAISPSFNINGIRWGGWNVDGEDIVYRNVEGQKHRVYGPAYISTNFDIEAWFKRDELHRIDGPALRHKKGLGWYKDGKRHRVDGPAVITPGGPKQYWIDGQKLSPKEYKKEIARRKRKGLMDEIL